MTRKQLLDNLEDAEELTYWRAYERIDPFGNERGDANAALVAATVHNAWMEPKVTVADYLPNYLKQPQQVDTSQFLASAYASSVNADINSKTRG